jgi:hypothetical protein
MRTGLKSSMIIRYLSLRRTKRINKNLTLSMSGCVRHEYNGFGSVMKANSLN